MHDIPINLPTFQKCVHLYKKYLRTNTKTASSFWYPQPLLIVRWDFLVLVDATDGIKKKAIKIEKCTPPASNYLIFMKFLPNKTFDIAWIQQLVQMFYLRLHLLNAVLLILNLVKKIDDLLSFVVRTTHALNGQQCVCFRPIENVSRIILLEIAISAVSFPWPNIEYD